MQTVDSSPITDRMQDVRDRGVFEFDSMLGAANAGTGFQGMANQRMGQATGMPGAFSARNDQMGMQGRSQAFGQAVAGRQHRDQMLSQLTGALMDVNAMNTNIQNQNAQQQWGDRMNRLGGFWDNLGANLGQLGSDYNAHRQHTDIGRRQDSFLDILKGMNNPQGGQGAKTTHGTGGSSLLDHVHPFMQKDY